MPEIPLSMVIGFQSPLSFAEGQAIHNIVGQLLIGVLLVVLFGLQGRSFEAIPIYGLVDVVWMGVLDCRTAFGSSECSLVSLIVNNFFSTTL